MGCVESEQGPPTDPNTLHKLTRLCIWGPTHRVCAAHPVESTNHPALVDPRTPLAAAVCGTGLTLGLLRGLEDRPVDAPLTERDLTKVETLTVTDDNLSEDSHRNTPPGHCTSGCVQQCPGPCAVAWETPVQ